MFRYLTYLMMALTASGCSAPEILEPRSALVPVDVDLSGNWQIRRDGSDSPRRLQEAIRLTDGIRDRDMYRVPGS